MQDQHKNNIETEDTEQRNLRQSKNGENEPVTIGEYEQVERKSKNRKKRNAN